MDHGLLPEPSAECRPKSVSLLDRLPEAERDVEVAQRLALTTEAFYALPEAEQELQIAKHERDRNKCPLCQGDRAKCSHADAPWYPQRSVCYAEMEKAAARRAYESLHKSRPFHDGTFTRWAEESSPAFPYHFMDGVNVWASPIDLAPDDDFTTNPNAVPRSVGTEAVESAE